MSELRVIHRDITALKYCNRGAREFFERHGFSWQEFMQQGISVDQLSALDDEMVRKAIAQAEKRVRQGEL